MTVHLGMTPPPGPGGAGRGWWGGRRGEGGGGAGGAAAGQPGGGESGRSGVWSRSQRPSSLREGRWFKNVTFVYGILWNLWQAEKWWNAYIALNAVCESSEKPANISVLNLYVHLKLSVVSPCWCRWQISSVTVENTWLPRVDLYV